MKKAYVYYIFALLLFGTNGIVANYIQLSGYEIVFYRTLIGSMLLLLILLLKKEMLIFYKYKKQFLFLIISGIAMGFSWIFLYEAYDLIGVGIASLIYYCGPVIVMALSPLIFKEKLTYNKIVGFLSVFCGILFVNGAFSLFQNNNLGIICALISALMYSFMIIFNKKAAPISGIENSFIQLFVSFLTVAVFTGIKQGLLISVDSNSIFPLLFLGLVNTGLGCYLYFSKLEKLPVQTVSILGYLEPLSAVMFSALILNESMNTFQIIGTIFIIGGALFAECFKLPIKK